MNHPPGFDCTGGRAGAGSMHYASAYFGKSGARCCSPLRGEKCNQAAGDKSRPARASHFLKTRCFTSGQNSLQALLAISDKTPKPVRASAALVVLALLTRQVFDKKLFPGIAM